MTDTDLAIIIKEYHEFESYVLYLFDNGESVTNLRKFVKKYIKKEIIAVFKKFFNNDDVAGGIIKEYYRRKIIQLYYGPYLSIGNKIDNIYSRFENCRPGVNKTLQRLFKTKNYIEKVVNEYNEKERE